MLKRFQGPDGRRLVVESFLSQKLVGGNRELAELLADKAQLREIKVGESLIEQGATDNDVYMIFAGAFQIVVNKRVVGRRAANDHVGEMAAVEPSQPRAASVVCVETAVVACVSEPDLAAAGKTHPEIYRFIAKELSRRLLQRNAYVGAARDRIKVFVISSVESVPIARIIQTAFAYDDFITTIWTDGVFRAGSIALPSLLEAIEDSDFAVAIAHEDDVTKYRDVDWPAPRDNVVFELGLFMGRLGKERAILMEPRDVDVKLPSDLAGVATIVYRFEKDGKDNAALMGPACNQLRDHIKKLGPNN